MLKGNQEITFRYILDGKIPVPEPDFAKWAKWYEQNERHIAHDRLPSGVEISTVFLGIDHDFFGNVPILFESMIFGGPLDGEQVRYTSWNKAEAGHKGLVKQARSAEVKH